MPITNVRGAPARSRRADRVGASRGGRSARRSGDGVAGHRAVDGSRSSGSSTSAAADRPDKIERAGDDDRARGGSPAPGRAPRPGPAATAGAGRRARRAPARRRARRRASPAAGPRLGRDDPRAARGAADDASAAMTPATSLSAIDAVTSVTGAAPAPRRRPEVVERLGEGRRAGRVVGTVEQDLAGRRTVEQLEPAGPTARRHSRAAARPSATRGDPGRLERVEHRVGDRRRSPPGAARAGRRGSARGRGSSTTIPSRSQPRIGARLDLGQRHAEPPRPAADDGERRRRSRRSRPGRRAR